MTMPPGWHPDGDKDEFDHPPLAAVVLVVGDGGGASLVL